MCTSKAVRLYCQNTMGPRALVLSGNDATGDFARRAALPLPSAIPCNLSSRIHSSLFSDWMRAVSSKFLDTQFFSVSAEVLVLPRYFLCALFRPRCYGHSSLELTEWKIIRAAPAVILPRTSLIAFFTVQLHGLCAAYSLATFCFSTTSGPMPCRVAQLWGSMIFRHAVIPRKGTGKNNKQQGSDLLSNSFGCTIHWGTNSQPNVCTGHVQRSKSCAACDVVKRNQRLLVFSCFWFKKSSASPQS